jgi:neutral amino acid transport system permease protein
MTPYLELVVNGCVQGMVIGLAALALNLVFAVARFPNAATGDMMTVGAYAGIGVQALGVRNIIVQGAAAITACVLLALAYYWAVFRFLRGRALVASLLASMGLALLTRSILTLFVGQEQYVFQFRLSRPLMIGALRVQWNDIWLAAICLATMAISFLILFTTPLGRRMRAIADDPGLARTSGISDGRVLLSLWMLVGAVTAIAGMVIGMRTIVTPELGWHVLLPAFAAAVLGGIGSPVGAVVAGIVLGIAQELSTPVLGFTYKIALSYVVLAAILTVRPRGLFGTVEQVR